MIGEGVFVMSASVHSGQSLRVCVFNTTDDEMEIYQGEPVGGMVLMKIDKEHRPVKFRQYEVSDDKV